MRLLRRRLQFITLFALLVGSLATGQAARADEAREPWATVNVCDTADAPDTIGIRASMPGSRGGHAERYMRFIVQYFSRSEDRWYPLGEGGDSGYLHVGKGRRARQFGRSFRIEPRAGESVLLRGRVLFQWRRDREVVRRASALTRKGHRSSAGDDPPGYTAATCTITSD